MGALALLLLLLGGTCTCCAFQGLSPPSPSPSLSALSHYGARRRPQQQDQQQLYDFYQPKPKRHAHAPLPPFGWKYRSPSPSFLKLMKIDRMPEEQDSTKITKSMKTTTTTTTTKSVSKQLTSVRTDSHRMSSRPPTAIMATTTTTPSSPLPSPPGGLLFSSYYLMETDDVDVDDDDENNDDEGNKESEENSRMGDHHWTRWWRRRRQRRVRRNGGALYATSSSSSLSSTDGNNNNSNNNNDDDAENDDTPVIHEMATFLTLRLGTSLLKAVQQQKKQQQQAQQQAQQQQQVVSLQPAAVATATDDSPRAKMESESETVATAGAQVADADADTVVLGMEETMQDEGVDDMDKDQLEGEQPKKMHKREGDRVVALGDDFLFSDHQEGDQEEPAQQVKMDDDATLSSLSSSSSMNMDGDDDDDRVETTTRFTPPPQEDVLPSKFGVVATESTTSAFIPEVVSLSFGRPLQVVASNTPSLREPLLSKVKLRMQPEEQQETDEKEENEDNTAMMIQDDNDNDTTASTSVMEKKQEEEDEETAAVLLEATALESEPQDELQEQGLVSMLSPDSAASASSTTTSTTTTASEVSEDSGFDAFQSSSSSASSSSSDSETESSTPAESFAAAGSTTTEISKTSTSLSSSSILMEAPDVSTTAAAASSVGAAVDVETGDATASSSTESNIAGLGFTMLVKTDDAGDDDDEDAPVVEIKPNIDGDASVVNVAGAGFTMLRSTDDALDSESSGTTSAGSTTTTMTMKEDSTVEMVESATLTTSMSTGSRVMGTDVVAREVDEGTEDVLDPVSDSTASATTTITTELAEKAIPTSMSSGFRVMETDVVAKEEACDSTGDVLDSVSDATATSATTISTDDSTELVRNVPPKTMSGSSRVMGTDVVDKGDTATIGSPDADANAEQEAAVDVMGPGFTMLKPDTVSEQEATVAEIAGPGFTMLKSDATAEQVAPNADTQQDDLVHEISGPGFTMLKSDAAYVQEMSDAVTELEAPVDKISGPGFTMLKSDAIAERLASEQAATEQVAPDALTEQEAPVNEISGPGFTMLKPDAIAEQLAADTATEQGTPDADTELEAPIGEFSGSGFMMPKSTNSISEQGPDAVAELEPPVNSISGPDFTSVQVGSAVVRGAETMKTDESFAAGYWLKTEQTTKKLAAVLPLDEGQTSVASGAYTMLQPESEIGSRFSSTPRVSDYSQNRASTETSESKASSPSLPDSPNVKEHDVSSTESNGAISEVTATDKDKATETLDQTVSGGAYTMLQPESEIGSRFGSMSRASDYSQSLAPTETFASKASPPSLPNSPNAKKHDVSSTESGGAISDETANDKAKPAKNLDQTVSGGAYAMLQPEPEIGSRFDSNSRPSDYSQNLAPTETSESKASSPSLPDMKEHGVSSTESGAAISDVTANDEDKPAENLDQTVSAWGLPEDRKPPSRWSQAADASQSTLRHNGEEKVKQPSSWSSVDNASSSTTPSVSRSTVQGWDPVGPRVGARVQPPELRKTPAPVAAFTRDATAFSQNQRKPFQSRHQPLVRDGAAPSTTPAKPQGPRDNVASSSNAYTTSPSSRTVPETRKDNEHWWDSGRKTTKNAKSGTSDAKFDPWKSWVRTMVENRDGSKSVNTGTSEVEMPVTPEASNPAAPTDYAGVDSKPLVAPTGYLDDQSSPSCGPEPVLPSSSPSISAPASFEGFSMKNDEVQSPKESTAGRVGPSLSSSSPSSSSTTTSTPDSRRVISDSNSDSPFTMGHWSGSNWASSTLKPIAAKPPSLRDFNPMELHPLYRTESGGYIWYTIPKYPDAPNWRKFAKYSGIHWTHPDHDNE